MEYLKNVLVGLGAFIIGIAVTITVCLLLFFYLKEIVIGTIGLVVLIGAVLHAHDFGKDLRESWKK